MKIKYKKIYENQCIVNSLFSRIINLLFISVYVCKKNQYTILSSAVLNYFKIINKNLKI